jgi:hypothetical protein
VQDVIQSLVMVSMLVVMLLNGVVRHGCRTHIHALVKWDEIFEIVDIVVAQAAVFYMNCTPKLQKRKRAKARRNEPSELLSLTNVSVARGPRDASLTGNVSFLARNTTDNGRQAKFALAPPSSS